LTYSIRVRPGFTFSPPSGAPVTAETFRYSIERALSPGMGDFVPAQNYLGDVAGLDVFKAGRARHISGLSARGNTLVIRLTKPLPDLPERLAMPFFSAVPNGTPMKVINDPIPSAGPYYLVSHDWYIVLQRNPNYDGPRPHELDGVVYEIELDPSIAAEQVTRGELDYVTALFPDPGPLIPTGEIARRYGNAKAGEPRWMALARSGIRFFRMNTSRGIFRDVKLRRAVNYALDRRALAALNAEPVAVQYLPSTMPGVRHASAYPLTRPNLARARALARGRGGRAVLYTCARADCTARARILKHNLAAIGVTVVVRALDDPFGAGAGFDIRDDGWYVDEYDPRDILQQLLFTDDPSLNPDHFDDPHWRGKVEAAARRPGLGDLRPSARWPTAWPDPPPRGPCSRSRSSPASYRRASAAPSCRRPTAVASTSPRSA
jgi:peptide/nickel transport system substrate-binding protein